MKAIETRVAENSSDNAYAAGLAAMDRTIGISLSFVGTGELTIRNARSSVVARIPIE